MNQYRNQRATRNNPAKPFVSGGVMTNFTNAPELSQPEPLVPPIQKSSIQINLNQSKPADTIQSQPSQQNQQIQSNQQAQQLILQAQQLIQQPQQVQPECKMESMSQGSNDNTDMMESENGSVNGSQKRRFIRQPIPKKVKRMRRNRRLRKMLTPKNALMSLHELLGTGLSEFNILPEERGFVATVFVNNVQYEGRGQSKMAAKNNASEKALRDIIITRMIQSPKLQAAKQAADVTAAANPNAAANADQFHEDVDMPDGGENENDEEEEVPMLHLASFALHKLFSEWQSEGFEIPDFRIGGTTSPTETMAVDKAVPTPGVPPKRTTLPENANTMHPTTLLCMMRPTTKYVDLGSEGQVPNILHRVGVEVDGNHFIGTAKNKKLARKYTAADACNQCFGTQFTKEEN